MISCNDNRKSTEVRNILKEWIDKPIIFPDELLSQDYFQNDFSKTILIYIDSTDCTECRLNVDEWGLKIRELREYNVEFKFIINPNNYKMAKAVFFREGLYNVIFEDVDYKFKNLNNIPQDVIYNVFLLNEDKNVVLLGNPIDNPAMWELYKKQLEY